MAHPGVANGTATRRREWSTPRRPWMMPNASPRHLANEFPAVFLFLCEAVPLRYCRLDAL